MQQVEDCLRRPVSRETIKRLESFVETLKSWNDAINLVSRHDLQEIWTRHILDSAQLFLLHRPSDRCWIDLGTGGGFPGLIVAILAAEFAPELTITLVESDHRKAAFLRTAAIACNVHPVILTQRAETASPLQADVLSARALAPLTQLLELASRHLAPTGRAIFPKGARADEEIASALATWRFDVQKIPSQTDRQGVVLVIEGVSRA